MSGGFGGGEFVYPAEVAASWRHRPTAAGPVVLAVEDGVACSATAPWGRCGCGSAVMCLSPRSGGGWEMRCQSCGREQVGVTGELVTVVTPPPDGEEEPCGNPSRFQVARSDGDETYGINGGSDECCADHLAETVAGMIDGDTTVTAVVTVRWDR
jgi:hypothetical protein